MTEEQVQLVINAIKKSNVERAASV